MVAFAVGTSYFAWLVVGGRRRKSLSKSEWLTPGAPGW
jgi:hypothetical protein